LINFITPFQGYGSDGSCSRWAASIAKGLRPCGAAPGVSYGKIICPAPCRGYGW